MIVYFFVTSAGVGRTGVFITLSIVLERMQYEGVVDVFQAVRILRTQRPAMVQTEVRTQTKVCAFEIIGTPLLFARSSSVCTPPNPRNVLLLPHGS